MSQPQANHKSNAKKEETEEKKAPQPCVTYLHPDGWMRREPYVAPKEPTNPPAPAPVIPADQINRAFTFPVEWCSDVKGDCGPPLHLSKRPTGQWYRYEGFDTKQVPLMLKTAGDSHKTPFPGCEAFAKKLSKIETDLAEVFRRPRPMKNCYYCKANAPHDDCRVKRACSACGQSVYACGHDFGYDMYLWPSYYSHLLFVDGRIPSFEFYEKIDKLELEDVMRSILMWRDTAKAEQQREIEAASHAAIGTPNDNDLKEFISQVRLRGPPPFRVRGWIEEVAILEAETKTLLANLYNREWLRANVKQPDKEEAEKIKKATSSACLGEQIGDVIGKMKRKMANLKSQRTPRKTG